MITHQSDAWQRPIRIATPRRPTVWQIVLTATVGAGLFWAAIAAAAWLIWRIV